MLTKKVLNNVYCRSRPVPTAKVLELAGGGVATGGKRATCPPPTPQIGHPVRSMQIRGDFRIRKNWGWFTGFAPTFYVHRRYGGRSLVLRLRKKRELWKLLKELLW